MVAGGHGGDRLIVTAPLCLLPWRGDWFSRDTWVRGQQEHVGIVVMLGAGRGGRILERRCFGARVKDMRDE